MKAADTKHLTGYFRIVGPIVAAFGASVLTVWMVVQWEAGLSTVGQALVAGLLSSGLSMALIGAGVARTIRDGLSARAHFFRLLEAVPEAVLGVDMDGRVVLLNSHAAALFGYSRRQLLNQPVELLIPERYREQHEQVRRDYQKAPAERGMGSGRVLMGRRRNGAEFPVDISLSPLEIPSLPLTLAFVRDISDRQVLWGSLTEAKARVEDELAARRQADDRRRIIGAMIELLQASRTRAEASEILNRHLTDLFADTAGAVYLFSPSRDDAEILAAWGMSPCTDAPFRLEQCWALRLGRPHVSGDGPAHVPCAHLGDCGSAALCIPLLAEHDTFGVFHLRVPADRIDGAGRDRSLADGWLTGELGRWAGEVAGNLSLALANLRLRESLRNQSIRDVLTGLFNRRYMEESLVRELKRAERQGAPVSVVLLDLDHFKRLNDEFGHDVGDALLRSFGQFLSAHVRGDDIACRYGGEEFALILGGMDAEAAASRVNAIREACHALVVDNRVGGRVSTSFSAGVATFPADATTSSDLLRTADLALYRAKSEGRDRVVVGASSAVPSP